ncbi:MAG TPA: family 20 glycosylhydrolase [Gemmatimonadaceae bacterium]|nr:family 20 glycosylhydrolase [Gemmatimonadaceae bacterium]
MRLIALVIATALLVAPATGRSQDDDPHLIPAPREIGAGAYRPMPRSVVVVASASPDDRFAAADLADGLVARGMRASAGANAVAGSYLISLVRDDTPVGARVLRAAGLTIGDEQRAEGYVLVAGPDQAVVVAASAAGIFYGAQTMKQLVRTDGGSPRVYATTIRDWPAMRWRGMQDDLSRGPLPTLEFQKKQIRTFAAYKLNLFSPYYEQTFEYGSNPLMSPPGGAMTREDAAELVEYAKKYHIEVVPEQEAFGHLHHVLKYDIYGQLAETPHGHVLAPGQPGSLATIKQWFDELYDVFPSQFVHIGADETFELGLGQTQSRVQQDSLGPVFMDFLRQIEATIRKPGKRYLFWGDIAQGSPHLVASLPKDMIAVAWNYWSFGNFDRSIKPFTDAGVETWVAPGVSNWNRVYPDNDVALRNIQGFVRDGQRLGANGMLNTNWDDDGEGIFNEVWYGVLFGAAAAWQKGEASIPAFAASYGYQFHGDPSGRISEAQARLSQAHAALAATRVSDATNALYWLDPFSSEGQVVAPKLRPALARYRILAESALVLVAQARRDARLGKGAPLRESDALDAIEMGARRMDFIGMKFELADEIVSHYQAALDSVAKHANPTHDLTEIASDINSRTQDLRDGYVLGRELYERSWREENRPYWLYNVLNRYDIAAQTWIRRIDQFNQARAQYNRTKRLPTMEQMGLPNLPVVTP